MRRLLLLVAVVAVGPFAAHAAPSEDREQAGTKKSYSITVDYGGDDEAGAVFNYELKEALRASRGLPLGSPVTADYEIRVLSTDLDTPARGISSYVSIALVTNSSPAVFVDHWAVHVGRSAGARMARRIVADVDKSIQNFAPLLPSLKKDLCGSR